MPRPHSTAIDMVYMLTHAVPGRGKGRGRWEGERLPYAGQQRWEEGGERMSEEGEKGGGIWNKVCWAVRISPQHR